MGFGLSLTSHYDLYYTNGKLFKNDRDFYKEYGICSKKKMQEFLSDKPYLEIRIRKPKARYIKLIGNRYENKEMMKHLKNKIKPYPKRKQARCQV